MPQIPAQIWRKIMKMNMLDKKVLKYWYVRAAIVALAIIIAEAIAVLALIIAETAADVATVVVICTAVPALLLLCFVLVIPALYYKFYSWGYDEKRVVVRYGVIFRRRVLIPVSQIQDLHRTQGPIMMMMGLSGVTVSTAGSNFNISTLTTEEADRLIDALEENLVARVEELKNEEI